LLRKIFSKSSGSCGNQFVLTFSGLHGQMSLFIPLRPLHTLVSKPTCPNRYLSERHQPERHGQAGNFLLFLYGKLNYLSACLPVRFRTQTGHLPAALRRRHGAQAVKNPGPDRREDRTRAGQILIIETNRFEFRLFEFGVCLLFGACNFQLVWVRRFKPGCLPE